jgi:hypothetical protein
MTDGQILEGEEYSHANESYLDAIHFKPASLTFPAWYQGRLVPLNVTVSKFDLML